MYVTCELVISSIYSRDQRLQTFHILDASFLFNNENKIHVLFIKEKRDTPKRFTNSTHKSKTDNALTK